MTEFVGEPTYNYVFGQVLDVYVLGNVEVVAKIDAVMAGVAMKKTSVDDGLRAHRTAFHGELAQIDRAAV